MKKRKVFYLKRERKEILNMSATSQLQCSNCKYVFPNYLTSCPECGSDNWIGYTEVNPYTRMPLESLLKLCGHMLWLVGTFICIYFFWQTNSDNEEINKMNIYYGILSLGFSILLSLLYFGLSEIIQRILRLQRRLKAFHETHIDTGALKSRSVRFKNKTLLSYGSVTRRNK